jgi:hypothetical protein
VQDEKIIVLDIQGEDIPYSFAQGYRFNEEMKLRSEIKSVFVSPG